MTVEDKIKSLIKEHFNPVNMLLRNDSAKHAGHYWLDDKENSHFTLTIVSDVFTNLSRIQRHQQVYQCLQELMDKPIHALTIHAYSPDEYKA